MTALVINETQSEGGGGHFLAKCNIVRQDEDVIRSAEEQDEKENLFSLCFTIVVA